MYLKKIVSVRIHSTRTILMADRANLGMESGAPCYFLNDRPFSFFSARILAAQGYPSCYLNEFQLFLTAVRESNFF